MVLFAALRLPLLGLGIAAFQRAFLSASLGDKASSATAPSRRLTRLWFRLETQGEFQVRLSVVLCYSRWLSYFICLCELWFAAQLDVSAEANA